MDGYKRIVYVDMDGVIVDWERGASDITGIKNIGNDHKHDDIVWPAIDKHGTTKFFAELPWMPDGRALWAFVNEHFVDIRILSVAGGRTRKIDDDIAKGKIEWFRHHIPLLSMDDIIFVNNKHTKQRYSKPDDIIIDDTLVVITEWNNKGGIGILNTSTEKTIKELQKYI